MKATGKIKIENGLELQNPTMVVKKVSYDWETNKIEIQCNFSEGVYIHSRLFEFESNGNDFNPSQIMQLIKTNEVLNLFE